MAFVAEAQISRVEGRVCYATDSAAVEYAGVRLMSRDSVFIAATMTDDRGLFRFENAPERGMYVDISAVGCFRRSVALPLPEVIYLENSAELEEVVVRASKSHVKALARGLTVNMEGNPVSQLGSAWNALKQMPLIDASGGGLEVLGRGTPLIYINNRLVRGNELELLSASDIKNVEIITNPSAKYGPEVGSVIRITTKKRHAGFHATGGATVSASEVWSESAFATLNYHTEGGLTIFGDASYAFSGFMQQRRYSDKRSGSGNTPAFGTSTQGVSRSRSQALTADGGMNYDFGSNAVGFQYTFGRTPKSHFSSSDNSQTDGRGEIQDISSQSNLFSQATTHRLNVFASFALPGSTGLRIDADYVGTRNRSASAVAEGETGVNILNTNRTAGTLWSGKLELTRKFGNVELELGADAAYTRSEQRFGVEATGAENFLHPETDLVRQNLYAGYASFDWTAGKTLTLYGGLRLESTRTRFVQNSAYRPDISPKYTDLMPNIGVSMRLPVSLSLYYRSDVSRPGYGMLDNTYVYVTPTLWETGNPALRPVREHKLGLNVYYKKFVLQTTLSRRIGAIDMPYRFDEGAGINVAQWVNLPNYNSLQIVASQRLDVGFWHPTLQGVLYAQDLRYGEPERGYRKPLYTLSLSNRFDIPGGFYAYLNVFLLGSGNQGTTYVRPTWQTSLTLNKTWRAWTFTLSAGDVSGTWRQRMVVRTNGVVYAKWWKGASQNVALSVRYTFNHARGSYKGKASRQDEIDRL